MFSIVMLTMNSIGRTISTISSVRKAISGSNTEIIVVDNGSTDGICEWLSNQSDIRLISNGSNLGVPIGRNLGIRASRGRYVLFLDNDVDLKPHAIPLFRRALSRRHIGIVGDSGSILIPEWVRDDSESHDTSDGDFPGTNFVVGFCMAMRRDVIDEVGPFDEGYPLFYWEDIDYALRIRKAGYDIAIVSETCYHHGSATVRSSNTSSHVSEVQKAGRKRTLDKHFDDCPTWVMVEGGTDSNLPELEDSLSKIRRNVILHVISPDLSVDELRPWRVVLPGPMYPRGSYSRICSWNDGWEIGPYHVPERHMITYNLNNPAERRPW